MKKKPKTNCPAVTLQSDPLKRGDIVRILPVSKDERPYWHCIAVVTWADPPEPHIHKGYPYCMRLLDHPYTEDIWLQHYERIGNVLEAVHLLESIRNKN